MPKIRMILVWAGLGIFLASSAQAGEKLVALTFDDGPNNNTPALLEILKKEGIKATFFLVGKRAKANPEMVKEIAQDGHEIENHSFRHPDLTLLPPERIKKEIEETNQTIWEITGKKPEFLRPPGGHYNREVENIVSDLKQKIILWTRYPQDFGEESSNLIYKRVCRNLHNQEIILLHNGLNPTLEALPRIIASFRSKGYKFVTVPELFFQLAEDPSTLAEFNLRLERIGKKVKAPLELENERERNIK